MAQVNSKNTQDKKKNEGGSVKPDPETLHTTDPQEHMEGPISSLVQKVKEGVEDNDQDDREEAEENKK